MVTLSLEFILRRHSIIWWHSTS